MYLTEPDIDRLEREVRRLDARSLLFSLTTRIIGAARHGHSLTIMNKPPDVMERERIMQEHREKAEAEKKNG